MKTIGLIIVGVLFADHLFAQECKVLKPEIANSYQGECKNGLAQGKGIAKGRDSYSGEFKKGYPDGTGTYVWANGYTYKGEWKKGKREGKGEYIQHTAKGDVTLVGTWIKDKYVGTDILPYQINQQQGVVKYSIKKVIGNIGEIRIHFYRAGTDFCQMTDLTIVSDSGVDEALGSYFVIRNAVFPVQIKVNCKMPNLLNSNIYDCLFNFSIMEKGTWEVIIEV